MGSKGNKRASGRAAKGEASAGLTLSLIDYSKATEKNDDRDIFKRLPSSVSAQRYQRVRLCCLHPSRTSLCIVGDVVRTTKI